MKQTDQAVLTRELQKAQASLTRAKSMAVYAGEIGLGKKLRAQCEALGETIVDLQGDQPKISGAALFPA